MHYLHGIRFAVYQTPYCVWEQDLPERNLEFIKGLTPEFFEYLASTHAKELEGPHRQLAAMALRGAYSQALETLFAIMFATLQAPDCVIGWLPRYRQDDLESLVTSVAEGRQILVKIGLASFSWRGVSDAIHHCLALPDGEKDVVTERVARLWSRFARDFLDPARGDEYNAIKHGLRGRPGGFRLQMGPPVLEGVVPTPEDYVDLGGSEFGSLFFAQESLGPRRHFRVRRTAVNWHPENLIHGLRLIAQSIGNIIAYLRFVNREPNCQARIAWPNDEQYFDLPWKINVGVMNAGFDWKIRAEDIEPFTEEQILAVYSEA